MVTLQGAHCGDAWGRTGGRTGCALESYVLYFGNSQKATCHMYTDPGVHRIVEKWYKNASILRIR